jgi:uncharacterized membrane protein
MLAILFVMTISHRGAVMSVKKVDSITLPNLLPFVTALLIVRVTVAVVLNYRDYLPPNFESDFLQDREQYFWKGYHWAFYTHLVSGPVSLILGMILISDRFRLRFPKWHRYLGRIQAVNVLFLVAPSGLLMASRAMTGPVAGMGFALLAVATAACMALGWRTAVQRRFAEHRRWMQRCFVLLCSAVVVRVIGGLLTVIDYGPAWPYQAAAWGSWLVPLLVFEIRQIRESRKTIETQRHRENRGKVIGEMMRNQAPLS